MPWATIVVAGCCVAAFTLAGTDALIYDRAAGSTWRLATASFAHYDLTHLGSNVAGFAVLGAAFERARGPRAMALLVVAVVTATMGFLYLALDYYVTYAGISAVNYALLGALAALALPAAPRPAIVTVAVAGGLQALVAQDLLPASVAGTRATWELHLLALAAGSAMALPRARSSAGGPPAHGHGTRPAWKRQAFSRTIAPFRGYRIRDTR